MQKCLRHRVNITRKRQVRNMKFREKMKYILKAMSLIQKLTPMLIPIYISRAIFDSVSPYVNIYLSGLVIDKIAAGAEYRELMKLVAVTVTVEFVLLVCSRILRKYLDLEEYTMFTYKLRNTETQKSLALDYNVLEDPEFHKLNQKREDLQRTGGYSVREYARRLSEVVSYAISIICSVTLTVSLFVSTKEEEGVKGFVCSPFAAMIILALLALNIFITIRSSSWIFNAVASLMEKIIEPLRKYGYYRNQIFFDYRVGKSIRLFKMQGLLKKEGEIFVARADDYTNAVCKKIMTPRIFSEVIAWILNISIYLFVGLRAIFGMFGVGALTRYIRCISQMTSAVNGVMQSANRMLVSAEAVKLYFDYMEKPSDMYKGSLTVEKRDDNEYYVEFCDVSFKYPNAENYALRHVNLKFKIGEKLAVVGMNGSGKTTFIKLMCRLYDPTEGEIKLNGVNIQKYDYQEYMSIFSIVFQDFKLFAFSLGQNVAANMEYDKARVEECLRNVNLGDRFDKFVDGTETYLYRDFDASGVEISGGEAQKIALARALYKDAPFIILDEPTAALDPIAEAEIYSDFNNIVGDKTAIYISHRLSSCRFCDKIAVFDHGNIVQKGSHEELIRDESGKYYELWHAQAQYYTV